jgi:predicted flap endonuclease-1-like 5' DNA nuclease
MSSYDNKISEVDKEKASLKANLNSAKAEADAAKGEMMKSDGELFGALGHIEDNYEVEALEGIGAGYGKKFRALGVSTTDEFASKFLSNEKEASLAAKETGIDKEAILAWASMADLISLPGINPDDAELLQAVGINSKKDLTTQDAKSLHDKMVAYNSKYKIAPDVPSTALLLKLTKLPDNKAIAKAVSAVKGDGEHKAVSYDIEEIEGIGPSYGKKFRSFGVSTTVDFADKFLDDDKAIEKAAKDTGITVNAIKAWASMADLMRLPGVDGQ